MPRLGPGAIIGPVRYVVDLLLPPTCAGCGAEGASFCATCTWSLARREREPAGWPIGLPATIPEGILQLEWCAAFSGPVRSAIHALKYGGDRRAAGPLAAAMAARWLSAGRGGDLLTWVPVHPTRKRERGFDQAELLCRTMAAQLGLPVLGSLQRHHRTVAQHALGRAQRAANVGEAFVVPPAWRPMVAGRWVVVVDDIVTTGATLASCARALLDGGAAAVSALAVARER